ncbi:MAG: sensor domain-containing diguanylate cyclase [Burkholderiales bacterium]
MCKFFINGAGAVRWLSALLLLAFIWLPCKAEPLKLSGQWYEAPPYSHCAESSELQCAGMAPVDKLDRTGGRFFWRGNFEIGQTTRLVVDFKNSSVIGRFHHRIFDDRGRLVAEAAGGIQSREPDPFFLRHGREFTLQPGHYRLVTEISSPFLLAQPVPYLDTLAHYRQAIQPGEALTLLCMGVLLGLMFYYAVLAGIRRDATDGFYALFILGNLLYNGTALLVYPDLFGLHWFYLISFPILFSNGSYVLFVLRLLDITSASNPWLYRLGMALLGLFAAFVLLALFKPNWSLELDRAGVGLFLGYGLLSGIVRNRQGHLSAPMYLAAVLVFFVLGALSISLGRLGEIYTIYIEHLGLLAVTVEVLLLALVLARQFSQLRMQYERAHVNATRDALTDLQNRRGFVEAGNSEVERSKRYGHPLSVIYLDLDNFKQLNDTRGHDTGDAALSAIAGALRSVLRSNDLLARLGGDEFAMLLPEIGPEAATEVGRKIFAAVNSALRDFPPVTASIGVIRFARVNATFPDIMKVADELMYEVKKTGKNDVRFRHYD